MSIIGLYSIFKDFLFFILIIQIFVGSSEFEYLLIIFQFINTSYLSSLHFFSALLVDFKGFSWSKSILVFIDLHLKFFCQDYLSMISESIYLSTLLVHYSQSIL